MIKIILSFALALFVIGCDDEQKESYIQGDMKPVLESFVLMNVDENITQATNKEIGVIPIKSFGGGGIYKFELSGTGADDIVIQDDGAIYPADTTVFDCTNQGVYNLKVKAYNDYGASNVARLYLQINCLDAPVINEEFFEMTKGESIQNQVLSFKRKGALNTNATITDTLLYKADSSFIAYGKSYQGISVTNDGLISIDSCSLWSDEVRLFVKSINNANKISPYSVIHVKVNNVVDYDPCSDQPNNPENPDNPDNSMPIFSDDELIKKSGVIDDTYPWNFQMNINNEVIKVIRTEVYSDSGNIYFDGFTFSKNTLGVAEIRMKKYAIGDYYLNVSGDNGTNFDFTVETKRDDIVEPDAYELTSPYYTNAIEVSGDVDTIRYDETQQFYGQTINIDSTGFEMEVEFLDERQNVIATQIGSSVSFQVGQKTIYYFKIKSNDGNIGIYSISFTN